MKTFTAISTAALIALAVPAFAQSTTKPNGTAGATSGTDTKGGSMTEGRSSVTDPNSNSGANSNAMGTTTKPNGTPGSTSGTDPK